MTRREFTGYRITRIKLPANVVGLISIHKSIKPRESRASYIIAWKVYEKLRKALAKAPLRVKVTYPKMIHLGEILFSLIPLAQIMLPHLALKYGSGFIVLIREAVDERNRYGKIFYKNIGGVAILPVNKSNRSSITFIKVLVNVHRHRYVGYDKRVETLDDNYVHMFRIEQLVSRAGYNYYYIAEKPLLILDVKFPSIEDVIRIVIEDGVEAVSVSFPLREPQWSLNAFPPKLVEDLRSILIEPLKANAKYAPRGLIVIGPPGVGKSVLVEAIAGELYMKILELSPGSYRSMWYGLTEKILLKLFEKLRKRADVLVLVDDAEFLSMRARSIHEVHLSEITMLLNILQRPDRPFISLTSNQPDIIDPALIRPGRIDLALIIGYPDREYRKIIARTLARKYSISISEDLVDYIAKTTRWFTNAEIDALIRLAASLGKGKITPEVIDKAKRRFKINDGERRRIQEYLDWYSSRFQGIVVKYVPREDEM